MGKKESLFFDIEFSKEKKIIKVGNYSITTPLYYNREILRNENIFNLKETVLRSNGIVLNKYDDKGDYIGSKNCNAQVVQYLGPKFNARIISITNAIWVDPIKPYLYQFCTYQIYVKPRFNLRQVERAWLNLDLIKQGVHDGLNNIIPFLIYFGGSPKKLKTQLGKGIWKRLSKNSITTNKLIVQILEDEFQNEKRLKPLKNYAGHKRILEDLTKLKPSLIKNIYSGRIYNRYSLNHAKVGLYQWLNKHVKVSKKNEVSKFIDIYLDTYKMALELNFEFKNWSKKRMIEQHDLFSKKIAAREYKDSDFSKNKDIMKKLCFISDDVEIIALASPLKVAIEALEMKHCLASYIDDIERGQYIALSLISEQERSTLGLFFNRSLKKWHIDQHYLAYNQDVENKKHLEAAQFICKKINTLI